MLYHALTCQPAFYAPTIEEVLQMHRLTEPNPDHRFPDASDAVRDLVRIHLESPRIQAMEVESCSVVKRIAKRTKASIRKLIDATLGAPSI